MKKDEAIAVFGSARALAYALNITEQAVSQWGDDVPLLRVYQIQELIDEGKVLGPKTQGTGTPSGGQVATPEA